ncbi:glycosyltransferase involved in cell wall biosynthesis [Pseudarthrobacter sp. W1I19]|nr:glycosyltransferase involved in cell wall biosynthesis [Pseudarthrobacter sp. W1I19]
MFLPAWNEAENLPVVVGQAVTYLSSRGEPFVVLIIDDGSSDNTAQVAATLKAANPGYVEVIQHSSNRGYGAALRTGFREGLRTGFDWVGFCDADGQFDPSDIGKLVDTAEATHSDIALGYRKDRADSLGRCLMGRAWRSLSHAVLGYHAIDVDCGFKAFRRDALLNIERQLISNHATISPEILVRADHAGLTIAEVGLDHHPRSFGKQSGADFHVVFASLIGLITVRHNVGPEPGTERKAA